MGREALNAVEEARDQIGSLIGASGDEICFTSGATEADNLALKGAAFALRKQGRHIVSQRTEHKAVLDTLAYLEGCGFEVTYLDVDAEGLISPKDFEAAIHKETILASVMAANNEIGTINPIGELATFAHGHGALFHTDAVQAIGHIPVDVRASGVDFLSASAHKFNGPKGIGFLFIRKGLKLDSLLDGGQQERGFRAGTENVASIVGMATALKSNCECMDKNIAHLNKLTSLLRDGIGKFFKGVVYPGVGEAPQLPGFTCVSFPTCSAEGLLHMLDLKGIAVSAGAACDSKNTQISHVLKAINAGKDVARSTIRISLGIENTSDDVATILAALRAIVCATEKLRG